MISAAIGLISRIAPAVAGASKTGAAKGVAKEGAASSSQVMGIAQSVMGIADETKNLIKDIAGKPFDSVADKMNMANSVVSNDANGLIQQMDGLPSGVKKFSQALSDLTNSIVESGRHLGMYSGELATAGGRADIKKIETEFREANYVNKSYSGVIDAKADFDSKLSMAMNPVKDAVATLTKELLEKLNSILDVVNENIEYVVAASEAAVALAQFVTGNWSGMVDTINDAPKKMAKAMAQENINTNFVKEIFNNTVAAEKDMKPRDIPLPGPLNMGMNFANFG